ncbi:5'-3' exoribonuclease Dhp1 [Schizosaccharomyces japonicus yFS275]|uniref:5'-3' exoribonuclease n=1 Tax=Schizosaccharomyces japonicus (strain yFS275 / FY16936) TaxID=402676 RepID=B6K211_SCHJY|nr:5'-3' exoribonuclease Dhp1 [Schizosaccharomyces japonicus yFS275]EEB07192.1 5'-3' exoribonuclease Dhp1 [Schizosaccharomyces japonicus yFS275]
MGIPALFRLLSRKYTKVITPVIEVPSKVLPDGTEFGPDLAEPNPNGECDNLYLDMNGIVHPCSHPEDRPPPETEDEMMLAVFEYTDRILAMVRPRNLLMIAIDGVAPRAKMNQQRSRRFRSAREAAQKAAALEECVREAKEKGIPVDENAAKKKAWDSNCITPGTPFMDILAKALRYYITHKLNTEPAFKNLRFLLSDASVPGEGEHKIMEFIRSQRVNPEYDPNTRHVIYGLDADLIMLGLATHEPHFRVLREDVFFQQGSTRRSKKEQLGLVPKIEATEAPKAPVKKPFIWLNVDILREYLEIELQVPNLPFPFDLERAIDDWVFFIFFVGNDFLPHLPSLDIRDGALERLTEAWRLCLPHMGGYLTLDGSVNLSRAEVILSVIGDQEDEIFRRLKQNEDRRNENQKRRRQAENNANNAELNAPIPVHASPESTQQVASAPPTKVHKTSKVVPPPPENLVNLSDKSSNKFIGVTNKDLINNRAANRLGITPQAAAASSVNKLVAANLKAQLAASQQPAAAPIEKPSRSEEPDLTETIPPTPLDEDEGESTTPAGEETSDVATAGTKRKKPETPELIEGDTVRLWEPGYRERYYTQKFHFEENNEEQIREAVYHYVKGLCWVLLYYYQGCPSWTWYYPFHYAPFAADFKNLSSLKISFDLNQPFKPYEQLLGVLPAASKENLPEKLQKLMTDPDSEIIDFYPENFVIDLNGKKFEWQGVALLPFIDEKRLLDAVAKVYPELTEEESRRNTQGPPLLFFSEKHPMYNEVVKHLYSKKRQGKPVKLSGKRAHGIFGKVSSNPAVVPNVSVPCPLELKDESARNKYGEVQNDTSMCVLYQLPRSHYVHKSMLLRGVNMPPRVLTMDDVNTLRAMRDNPRNMYQRGRRNGGGYGNGGGHSRYGQSNSAPPYPPSRNGYGYGQNNAGYGYGNQGYSQAPWTNGGGYGNAGGAGYSSGYGNGYGGYRR